MQTAEKRRWVPGVPAGAGLCVGVDGCPQTNHSTPQGDCLLADRWEPEPRCMCSGYRVETVSELAVKPTTSAVIDAQNVLLARCAQLPASVLVTAQD